MLKTFIPKKFLLFFCILAFCILSILAPNTEIKGMLFTCILLFLTTLSFINEYKTNNKKTSFSDLMIRSSIVLFFTVLWDLYILYKGFILEYNAFYIEIYGCILLNYYLIIMFKKCYINKPQNLISSFKEIIKTHRYLLILCFIFLIGSFSQLNSWMVNDGTIYHYGLVEAREKWNFYNIHYLNLGGHGGYAYCLLALFGDLLFNHKTSGVIIVNIIMAIATIISFYAILGKHCVKIKIGERTILTAVFAFSPLLYGMIGDINLEFPQLCFFTWLICAHTYKNKKMQFICSMLFCFTKETSVVVYISYCFGCFLFNLIKNKEKNLFTRFFHIIKHNFKFDFIVGFVWLSIYLLFHDTTWTSNLNPENVEKINGIYLNTFSFWLPYIKYKIKQIFFFNGTWIIWLIAILALVTHLKFFYKKRAHFSKEIYWGLIFSYITFLFIQLFYVTWTNYRYVTPTLLYEMLFFSILVYFGLHKFKIKKQILIILVGIVFMSNYFVFDPFSNNKFISRDTGNGEIIISNLFSLDCLTFDENGTPIITRTLYESESKTTATRDCLFYNRQLYYFGRIFEEILNDIDYDDKTLIIVPNLYDDIETTCHNVFYRDEYVMNLLYRNKDTGHININDYRDYAAKYPESKYQKLNIKLCSSKEELNDLAPLYERVYIIVPNYNSAKTINEILGDIESINTSSYTENIFKVSLLKFK